MTPNKKKEFKKYESLVIKDAVVKFSNLKEAKGFKDSEENKVFGITITVGEGQAVEVEKTLETALENAYQDVLAQTPKAEQKKVVKGRTPTSVEVDESDNETGRIVVRAKRPERSGPPKVYDKEQKEIERAYLRRGSTVDVAVAIKPYKMNGTVGVTLLLQGVLVKEEVQAATHDNMLKLFTVAGQDLAKEVF